jgi:hypothetical protein
MKRRAIPAKASRRGEAVTVPRISFQADGCTLSAFFRALTAGPNSKAIDCYISVDERRRKVIFPAAGGKSRGQSLPLNTGSKNHVER